MNKTTLCLFINALHRLSNSSCVSVVDVGVTGAAVEEGADAADAVDSAG
jgi:hypothetical protein